ncbi:hypothetical protein BGX31_001797 [Mortierella sp. GBA43]|nr:hypothetical protein BGX31_001797 [Mortierella sp. GBA43]
MVRFSLFIASILAATCIVPGAHACEGDCRNVPVKFLAEKYTEAIQSRLETLPAEERHHEAQVRKAIGQLPGVIDDSIFSRFHSNCHDKPPRRSPDEVCGSAKSIACFAPWGHHNSVFDDVHEKVVRMLEETLHGKNTSKNVKQVIIDGVRNYCPGECKDWEKPFQNIMLKWEEKEHHTVYQGRVPNCVKGRMSF